MARYGSYNGGWPRYVPVAERRAKAEKEAKKMQKGGQKTNPVVIAGRTIASTFGVKRGARISNLTVILKTVYRVDVPMYAMVR